MTNEHRDSDSGWKPCEIGLIGEFAQRLKNRRRVILTAQIAGGAALGGALLALLLTVMPDIFSARGSVKDFNYGGITCSEVQSRADAYIRGELDEPTVVKISAHLKECPLCSVLIDRMKQEDTSTSFRSSVREKNTRISRAAKSHRRFSWIASAQHP